MIKFLTLTQITAADNPKVCKVALRVDHISSIRSFTTGPGCAICVEGVTNRFEVEESYDDIIRTLSQGSNRQAQFTQA